MLSLLSQDVTNSGRKHIHVGNDLHHEVACHPVFSRDKK